MKRGVEQFKDWMKRRGFTQRDAAAHFGWDATDLSRMLAGRVVPGLPRALEIERETGIPVEAWVSSGPDKTGERAAATAAKSR